MVLADDCPGPVPRWLLSEPKFLPASHHVRELGPAGELGRSRIGMEEAYKRRILLEFHSRHVELGSICDWKDSRSYGIIVSNVVHQKLTTDIRSLGSYRN